MSGYSKRYTKGLYFPNNPKFGDEHRLEGSEVDYIYMMDEREPVWMPIKAIRQNVGHEPIKAKDAKTIGRVARELEFKIEDQKGNSRYYVYVICFLIIATAPLVKRWLGV